MPDKKEAEFLECQTWFVARARTASKSDSKFYVVMSPEETIEFLKAHLTPAPADGATVTSWPCKESPGTTCHAEECRPAAEPNR